jgi:hypothetical protein
MEFDDLSFDRVSLGSKKHSGNTHDDRKSVIWIIWIQDTPGQKRKEIRGRTSVLLSLTGVFFSERTVTFLTHDLLEPRAAERS